MDDQSYAWTSDRFDFQLLNGQNGDPALYVQPKVSCPAILFDLGNLAAATHRQLIKARIFCVSHTHMDHFIGFDQLLRATLNQRNVLYFFGPKGLAQNISHKLKGYHWNLIEPDQIVFFVAELDRAGKIEWFRISNANHFEIGTAKCPDMCAHIDAETQYNFEDLSPVATFANLESGIKISGVALDHGIDSVAFFCTTGWKYRVRIEEIRQRGFVPGSWIKLLQRLASLGSFDQTVEIEGAKYLVRDLASDFLEAVVPQGFAYVTDAVFSEENLKRLQQLIRGPGNLLVCETNYRDAERTKAFEKKHLTTRQAALFAASVGAEQLRIFHISQIYRPSNEESVNEAQRFFEEYVKLESQELEQASNQEMSYHVK